MRVNLYILDGNGREQHIEVTASGQYSPDVMHDLTARAKELIAATGTVPVTVEGTTE